MGGAQPLPRIAKLGHEDLIGLARWQREGRSRARDIVRDRRRVRRGKAEPRGAAQEAPSERGLTAKKQVFARAPRRVNARIERLLAEARRAQATAGLRAALEGGRNAPMHHPGPGRTAGRGMRPMENQGNTVEVDPHEAGRVSQFVRDAQARRNARPDHTPRTERSMSPSCNLGFRVDLVQDRAGKG